MDCPTCKIAINQEEYENVPVFQCPRCAGYLVGRNRVLLIKNSQIQSSEALHEEAESRSRSDVANQIRCPKCRVRNMRKERVVVDPENCFSLDVCRDCNMVWFDGGELARIQIKHEQSAKALEAYAFQQKAQNRTEAEALEIQQNLDALPRSENSLAAAVRENFIALSALVLSVATVILFYLNFSNLWVSSVSLLGAASLGFLCTRMLDSGRTRLISLVALGAVEICFLVYVFSFR